MKQTIEVRDKIVSSSNSPLTDLVEHSQLWSRVRAPLPRRRRRALCVLISVELLWATWLFTIVIGASRCDGFICKVATLDRHTEVLLVFAVVCLTGLLGLAAITGGLSRCNGNEAAGLGVAAAAGGGALLGIAALLLGVVIVLIIFAVFFAALTPTP